MSRGPPVAEGGVETPYTRFEDWEEDDYAAYFYEHDAAQMPPATVPYLVAPVLPRAMLTLLAGPPKEGKTDLATSLAFAVATGTPFAGEPVVQAGVLWADFEQSRLERRFAAGIAREEGGQGKRLAFCHALPGIDTPEGFRALEWYLSERAASLVVIDSLWAAVDRSDVSRPRAARQALGRLARMTSRYGAACLVIHHTEVTGRRPSASTQLQAAAGLTLVQSMEERPDGTRLVHLRGRGRGVGSSRTSFVSEGPGLYRAAGPGDLGVEAPHDRRGSAPLLAASVVAAVGAGERLGVAEIAERAGMMERTAAWWLNKLVRDGTLRIVGVEGRCRMFARAGDGPTVRPGGERDPTRLRLGEALLSAFGPGEELTLYEIAARRGMVYETARVTTNRLVREGRLRIAATRGGSRLYARAEG